jgi:ferredoxin
MALMITNECINCGACEPECPNSAIYEGGANWVLGSDSHDPLATDNYYIVPEKCTECEGFHESPQCAAVCPVDCCVKDPNNAESKEELLVKKDKLDSDGR